MFKSVCQSAAFNPAPAVPAEAPRSVRLLQGAEVTLHDRAYGVYTHGVLDASAWTNSYGVYTIIVGRDQFRSEGVLLQGWV